MDALPYWWRVLENRSSLSGTMITEVSKRGESEVVGIGISEPEGNWRVGDARSTKQ